MDTQEDEEKRQSKDNSSTIIKLQEFKNISFYWNSMSEMFIPNSVWEQSINMQYGVFELIDASMIHEMMKDMFDSRVGMQNEFIIDPFSMRIQFAFRNWYDMGSDEYKYRIAVLQEKIRVNVSPPQIRDIMRFKSYLEG